MRHQLEQIKRYFYGRKSEKVLTEPYLFLYAGLLKELESVEEAVSEEEPPEAEPALSSPRRKNGKRRQVAVDLPVERIEYALPKEKCVCEKCGGRLEKFGEEITRQVDYRPASLYIREHVRFKYACPCCRENVRTSEMPTRPIEKGMPGSGLLANVLTSKYCDHLPLYRQAQIYARHGIELSRKTLCDWVKMCGRLVEPLYEWMKKEVLQSDIIQTDDTPVPVQDRSRKGTRQGRLWVYLGDENHAHVVYDYTPNRSRDGPVDFLKGFRGYLQADAYAGYDILYRSGDVIEVGCMAHCRRKFFDAASSDAVRAHGALAYIGCLYKVEREAKAYEEANGLVGEERAAYRCAMRQEKSQPILERFHDWLREREKQVLPKSPMGEAIGYALGQWEALNRYIHDGRLEIDNNTAEREIRPIAVGRKNYLFLGSDGGGRSAAIIYSLIRTCKRHGVEPFAYLRDVLERIPDHPIHRIEELTPLAWKQAHVES
jgi:transposase